MSKRCGMQRFPGGGGDNRCASFGEERRGVTFLHDTKKAAPHVRSSPLCGEKKQSADEPGFVLCGAKCSSFIWMCRRRHILSFYPPTFLRRESNEPPSNVGLHELSASEVHGLPCHHGNRWALTPPSHPYRRAVRNLAPAVIFFCTSSPSQTTSH